MKTFYLVILACLLGAFNAKAEIPKYSFGVRIIGKGKPMLLIPGFKGSADTFNEIAAHYQGHYKCYIITLAGFAGQPPSDVNDHLLLKQRDDIIRYITDQHLHKPTLVGFSFEAGLALWVACAKPDLIGPIIDLDGAPFDAGIDIDHLNKDSLIKAEGARYTKLLTQTPSFWKTRDSVYHSPPEVKQGDIEVQKLVSDTGRIAEIDRWDKASDFKSAVLLALEADTLDLRGDVAKIKSPILLLGSWRGYNFIKTKAEAEERYKTQLERAKNITILFSENSKHFLMWEDFDWMIGEMDKFLLKYD